MNKEIYIRGMDWKRIKDNQGGLTLMITFKDNVSQEEYIELMKRNYYFLTTKEEHEELKQRINKAIEYLKNREYDNNTCSVCSVMSDDLLKILKGE